ncbi:MAG TPA: DUF4157 domain-containing protein [Thermoanaerobaculia bacterium]|nr:DUF4157 domain-containing protein [Thermoanaerobaculia bacterium]
MRTRKEAVRSSREGGGRSITAPETRGRSGPAAERTQPGGPRETRDGAPHRLPPVFAPRRTVVEEIGEALGEDVSTVRIETRSREAVALGADAFARREEVCFAPGQYRPDTTMGRRLIAHELAHVAQQRRSQVPATGAIGGQKVNEDPRLEQQADQAGARAAAGITGAPAPLPPPPFARNGMTSSPAQMGKVNKAARAAQQQRVQAHFDRERQRREDEIARLARKSSDELRAQWTGIRHRTNRTLAKIREIDLISQAHPRPRRLQGQDRAISDQLDQLDRQARILIDNFDAAGLRGGRVLEADKKLLATLIVKGKALELELGQVSSEAEARLGPREVFAGDLNSYVYHTGANNDPIPIVWYKNPATDYRDIVIPAGNAAGVAPGNYTYPNGPTTANGFPVNLTVAAANRPVLNNLAAFTLQKQPIGSRPDQTPNQVAANAALANAGYNLRNQHPQMDGDHVRDLGFGGADAVNNYWPLDEDINRRAFRGYNSNYLINFINHTKDPGQVNPNHNPNGRPTTQPIGGMAGRYFVIKDFMDAADDNIPDESEEETAGTA